MFFPPCFHAESEITIWGPSSPEASLEERIARYISAPLSPVEVRELPCDVSFLDTPASEWEIGPATIRAEAVTHRGPTLGYRITDGDTHPRLHPRPRAGPRRAARDAGARVDLRLRPRPGRRPADPRLPVHRRGVPRPRRLGPLAAHRHPHLRPPGRGQAAAALPPRPAALRRLPRRRSTARGRALAGAGRRRRTRIEMAAERQRARGHGAARRRVQPRPGRSTSAGVRSAQGRSDSSWAASESSVASSFGRADDLHRQRQAVRAEPGRDRGGRLAGVVPGDGVGIEAALADQAAERAARFGSGRARTAGPAVVGVSRTSWSSKISPIRVAVGALEPDRRGAPPSRAPPRGRSGDSPGSIARAARGAAPPRRPRRSRRGSGPRSGCRRRPSRGRATRPSWPSERSSSAVSSTSRRDSSPSCGGATARGGFRRERDPQLARAALAAASAKGRSGGGGALGDHGAPAVTASRKSAVSATVRLTQPLTESP